MNNGYQGITVTDDLNIGAKGTDSAEDANTTSIIDKVKAKANNLSPEETREILTPFAFKIDQSLFGVPLAVPWRRGVALLIDLLLVAILSGAPGELLAVLVAITLFKVASNKYRAKFGRKSGFRQTLLRFVAVFIVFVVLVEALPKMFSQINEFNSNVEQAAGNRTGVSDIKSKQNIAEDDTGFAKAALTVATSIAVTKSECDNYSCWLELTTDLLAAYAEQSPSEIQLENFMSNLIENVTEKEVLNDQQLEQLSSQLKQSYLLTQQKNKDSDFESTTPAAITDNNHKNESDTSNKVESNVKEENSAEANSSNATVYKGFAWLQGLIEDLGIGFGWAAFYFTMFTALWHGQTPGKKFFRIRVIQLDGTPLSVWDSFGRYGGYGAGIATGLLGFAQIYWDPNRQAIHDKISATIVINDNGSYQEKLTE
jgi:uncharacterized RDD family membrane protein YckC